MTCGTASGAASAARRSQATAAALRLTGARQSAATRSFSRARLTTKGRLTPVTSQMSEATPPVSGTRSAASSAPMSPSSRSPANVAS